MKHRRTVTTETTHVPTAQWAPDHIQSLDTLSQSLQDHEVQLHLQLHTNTQRTVSTTHEREEKMIYCIFTCI